MPRPPARVEQRKRRRSESSALKASMLRDRCAGLVDPSRRTYGMLPCVKYSSRMSSMEVKKLKSTTRWPCAKRRSSRRSRMASLPDAVASVSPRWLDTRGMAGKRCGWLQHLRRLMSRLCMRFQSRLAWVLDVSCCCCLSADAASAAGGAPGAPSTPACAVASSPPARAAACVCVCCCCCAACRLRMRSRSSPSWSSSSLLSCCCVLLMGT
mmetsp:Transcript_7822/g.22863  ORF Transcript_7822/g.22863 Transcript_7822/m.22863 type:complete len:211 (-) Transcript_7822:63-695(-)